MHGVTEEHLSHITRDDVVQIASVQQEIYSIVVHLCKQHNTTTIYLEGPKDENIYETRDSAARFAQFFWNREMLNLNKANLLSDIELVNTARGLDEYLHGERSTLPLLAYYPGAAYILALQKEIDIRVAEQRGVTDSECRENLFVYKIAHDQLPYAPLILGAGHCLQDNVADYNAKHPSHHIDILEIRPPSLR